MTSNRAEAHHTEARPASAMRLSSPAFENGGAIPREFVAEGPGYSPPLRWENLPEGARALALTVIDYDIPSPRRRLGRFVHWVVYNLPAGVRELPANFGAAESVRLGASLGRNGAGQRGYYPPCPVWGEHAYVFRLLALDTVRLEPRADDYSAVMEATAGHVLGSAELAGVYRRTALSAWQALARNIRLGSRRG